MYVLLILNNQYQIGHRDFNTIEVSVQVLSKSKES